MFISQRQNLRTFGYVWWQREKERIKTVLIIKYTYFSTVRKSYNTHPNMPRYHTCDLSRSGVKLPIMHFPLRPPDEAAKIPIFMNFNFWLFPKAKTLFSDHRRRLLYLNLQQATIDLYWFSATGKSTYRLGSVNKNQHIFRTTGCSGCTY